MTKLLSREQVNQYHNSGFVSPVDVLTQDEIKQSINEIENFEEETGHPIDFPISHDVINYLLGQTT